MTTIDKESLGSYPEIEMCSPLKLVTSPPPSRIYSPPSPIPSHIPVRHPFANPAPTSNTTHTNVSPEKQYCNFRVGSFESPPAPATASPLRILNHQQSYEQPVVPEPSKVYRKSPFLPRKNKSPESSTTAPKKESKLSTLGMSRVVVADVHCPDSYSNCILTGSSLLKNLTTSPFSQRKQSVPPPELPPMLVEKRPLNNNFPSHHQPAPPLYSHHHPQSLQHQSRVEGAVGNSQLPRAIFHNSPILHRRNPSYISYGDCSASPSKGRGSANTSPIGMSLRSGNVRVLLITPLQLQFYKGSTTSKTNCVIKLGTNDRNTTQWTVRRTRIPFWEVHRRGKSTKRYEVEITLNTRTTPTAIQM